MVRWSILSVGEKMAANLRFPLSDRDPTWIEAIRLVLAQAGKPMHYSEIAQEIEAQGIRHRVGETPVATVSALLSGAVGKANSDFLKLSRPRGFYALKEFPLEWIEDAENVCSNAGALKAFGLGWKRQLIDWDVGLLGNPVLKSEPVDVSDDRGIVILYRKDKPRLAGRAPTSILTKLKELSENKYSDRWDEFSWFSVGSGAPGTLGEEALLQTIHAILACSDPRLGPSSPVLRNLEVHQLTRG